MSSSSSSAAVTSAPASTFTSMPAPAPKAPAVKNRDLQYDTAAISVNQRLVHLVNNVGTINTSITADLRDSLRQIENLAKNPEEMADEKLEANALVTIPEYRSGVFGSFPDMTTGGRTRVPATAALHDCHTAVSAVLSAAHIAMRDAKDLDTHVKASKVFYYLLSLQRDIEGYECLLGNMLRGIDSMTSAVAARVKLAGAIGALPAPFDEIATSAPLFVSGVVPHEEQHLLAYDGVDVARPVPRKRKRARSDAVTEPPAASEP